MVRTLVFDIGSAQRTSMVQRHVGAMDIPRSKCRIRLSCPGDSIQVQGLLRVGYQVAMCDNACLWTACRPTAEIEYCRSVGFSLVQAL